MIKRGLLVALMLLPSLAVFSAQQPAAEKSVYVVTIIDVIPLPGGLVPSMRSSGNSLQTAARTGAACGSKLCASRVAPTTT